MSIPTFPAAPNDYRPWETDPNWTNADPGDRALVKALDIGKKGFPYTWLVRVPRFFADWFAYPYVGAWLLISILCFSTSPWWVDYKAGSSLLWFDFKAGYRWLIVLLPVLVPVYRLLDILRWWLSFIFDRRHNLVVAWERNLIFLALNLLEIVFVGAILFRATGVASSLSGCWYKSFFLVTQLNLPVGTTFWQQASMTLVEISSLVLLLGGLSALIDSVGRKLREGAWSGPGY